MSNEEKEQVRHQWPRETSASSLTHTHTKSTLEVLLQLFIKAAVVKVTLHVPVSPIFLCPHFLSSFRGPIFESNSLEHQLLWPFLFLSLFSPPCALMTRPTGFAIRFSPVPLLNVLLQ